VNLLVNIGVSIVMGSTVWRRMMRFTVMEMLIQQSFGNMTQDYAIKEVSSFGGFILVGSINETIVSIVVINKTGMKGYIPENILVYIATNKDYRGKGIGKTMMEETIKLANGSVALHVKPNNLAKYLYEKLGFTNKYLEMRLTK